MIILLATSKVSIGAWIQLGELHAETPGRCHFCDSFPEQKHDESNDLQKHATEQTPKNSTIHGPWNTTFYAKPMSETIPGLILESIFSSPSHRSHRSRVRTQPPCQTAPTDPHRCRAARPRWLGTPGPRVAPDVLPTRRSGRAPQSTEQVDRGFHTRWVGAWCWFLGGSHRSQGKINLGKDIIAVCRIFVLTKWVQPKLSERVPRKSWEFVDFGDSSGTPVWE